MPIPFLGLATLGVDAIKQIPSGKGRRKASANFLYADSQDLDAFATKIEEAMNRGEVLSGFAGHMIVARIRSSVSVMETTVEAINPKAIEETETPGQ